MGKNIQRVKELLRAVIRFPITAVFLLGAFWVNMIDINARGNEYRKYFFTLIVGACLSAALQMVYERFCKKGFLHLLLTTGVLSLDLGYYFMIRTRSVYSEDVLIITMTAIFALLITFIWIPVINSKFNFNESFMSGFKSFFISVFFATVILIGGALIIGAAHQLLFPVDSIAYAHVTNAVYILFAPIYFLSLTPRYPGKEDKEKSEEDIKKAVSCPKYLEILLSYIIIPMVIVFTAILLMYILINIRSRFWADNLLEPMLVAFAITVIVVYIMVSGLENQFVKLFQKVFPKILLPVVMFQTFASALKIRETGITYGRYYAILIGVFAIISGVIFILKPLGRNGVIAAALIIFSIISIIPPTDAFTVSRRNQASTLKKVLEKNQMLKNNRIAPNPDISIEDQEKIRYTVKYLRNMDYISEFEWLMEYEKNYDFKEVFGFQEYETDDNGNQEYRHVGVSMEQQFSIGISGSDSFSYGNIWIHGNVTEEVQIGETVIHNKTYRLIKSIEEDEGYLILKDEENQEIIRFRIGEVVDRFQDYGGEKGTITSEEGTFSIENDQASMIVMVQNFYMDKGNKSPYYSVDFYVFYKIK